VLENGSIFLFKRYDDYLKDKKDPHRITAIFFSIQHVKRKGGIQRGLDDGL
jgi:hypothetical protein